MKTQSNTNPHRPTTRAAWAAMATGATLLALACGPQSSEFSEMQLRAKRSEVPVQVKAIHAAEMAHFAEHGAYLPCGSTSSADTLLASQDPSAMRPWSEESCWQTLLEPVDRGEVRGVYWVTVSEDGQSFEVVGLSDIDGDGQPAVYQASDQQNAVQQTPINVY